MILRKVVGTFLMLLWISFKSYGQTQNELVNSSNSFNQNVLEEKLFVHTDKSVYSTGEVLWFKIYNINAGNHQPLNTSKVAYLEVLDHDNLPVLQTKVALKAKGSGNGSLYIPASLLNGNYKLRAYTNWMKNFGYDHYFEKKLTIINPLKSPDLSKKGLIPAYDIQFFPEGGNLVAGLSSKLAFKVVGPDGKGVDFKGAIINQHNDTIARFAPLKFGMGNFTFKPNLTDNYKAVFNIEHETKPIFKGLPTVSKQGFVIRLNDQEKQLEMTVSSNLNVDQVYLLVHAKNVSKYMQRINLNNGTTKFTIDKNLLSEGISHLTVFNNEKQPVCERLYFKRPAKRVFLTADANKKQYSMREKVNIDMAVTDLKGRPLVSDLSLSVYQIDSLQKTDAVNFVNSIWLTSELRGDVESPDYYFNSQDKETDVAADNLMLTQGWSKFNWDPLLKNTKPAFSFLPEYAGHLITAKLTDEITNKPAKNVVTYLSVPGKRVQLYVSRSDSLGYLLFNTKDFYGLNEIVIQTNEQQDSTYRIEMLSPFSESYTSTAYPALKITPELQSALTTHNMDMQVQNIYSGPKLKQFYDPGIDSSSFFGKSFVAYKLDDYTRFTTMEEVLREYVKSVMISKQQKRFHIKVVGENARLDGNPMVILDGVPIFNIDKVMAIDPLKVRKLDLVKSSYFWQAAEFEGILNFTTYKGDLAGYEFDPKAVIVDYEGMQLEREFYSPVYETDQQKTSRLPDFRNVLYWSPNTFTKEDGKTKANFYTADREGNYVGVLQGITASGDIGCQYFKFQVKQKYGASLK